MTIAPELAVTEIVPFAAPLQVTLVAVAVIVTGEGCVMDTEEFVENPNASVTVTA